jgi:hypothetical protein
MVCFLVSLDRSYISTHQEQILLLLKVNFHIKFFDFLSGRSEPRKEKWRQNLSKYGAQIQDILLLFTFIITEDLMKKNGAKF